MSDSAKKQDVAGTAKVETGSSAFEGSPQPDTSAIDNLLDDALNDFDTPSNEASTSSQRASSDTRSHKAPAFDPLGKPKSMGQPKPIAFNPLPARQPTAKGRNFRSQGDANSSREFGAVPPDVSDLDDDLSKGLAQLMKELAKVDGDSGAVRPSGHLSETLRALSEESGGHKESAGRGRTGDPADLFNDPIFAGLQEQLSGGSGTGLGGLADGLMRQLLSKEVLYQPMKDIGARYPAWLQKNRDQLPSEEVGRFEEQYRHIRRIQQIYEEDPDNFNELFQALQQMQACGQPPQDIVDELAPGMSFDDDGLPKFSPANTINGPAGCCIQ